MTLSPEDLYRRLGRLIEECPAFGGVAPLSVEQLKWLGRAEALVVESKDISSAVKNLPSY